mgnify:CR=1 FL=1
MVYSMPVVIQKDEEGYFASCPVLQGCYAQGTSYEEAIANILDAIALGIKDRVAHGEALIVPELVSVTNLQVAA